MSRIVISGKGYSKSGLLLFILSLPGVLVRCRTIGCRHLSNHLDAVENRMHCGTAHVPSLIFETSHERYTFQSRV